MKKAFIVFGLLILILGGAAAYIFIKPSSTNSWKFDQTIKQPIVAVSGKDNDVTIGNLTSEKISVAIPKGSFDTDTKLMLANPKDVPQIAPSEIATIGAPIEISADKPVRLNDKTTITFGFDKKLLPQNTKAYQLRVAYYNGTKWDYIKPISVDWNTGTMTFGTYHF